MTPSTCLVPRPPHSARPFCFGSDTWSERVCKTPRCLCRIRHRNAFIENAWEDAAQGVGKLTTNRYFKQFQRWTYRPKEHLHLIFRPNFQCKSLVCAALIGHVTLSILPLLRVRSDVPNYFRLTPEKLKNMLAFVQRSMV